MVYATCTLRAAENEAVGVDTRCTRASLGPSLAHCNCRCNDGYNLHRDFYCWCCCYPTCSICRCSHDLRRSLADLGRRTSSPRPSPTPGVPTWILERLPSSRAAGPPRHRPTCSSCCRANTEPTASSLLGTEGPPMFNCPWLLHSSFCTFILFLIQRYNIEHVPPFYRARTRGGGGVKIMPYSNQFQLQ